jgi:hypothetical protein
MARLFQNWRRQTDLDRAKDAFPGSGFSSFRPAIAELTDRGNMSDENFGKQDATYTLPANKRKSQ